LVLLEMADKRELPAKLLPLTPELAFRFYSYWKIVAHRRTQRPDVRYPFYHLQSDGFWTSLDEDGKPSPNDRLTRFAELPSDFVECAKQPAWREKARRLLIAKYFEPAERVALYTLVGLPIPAEDEIARDAKSPTEARREGREARFRLNVVAAYDYACALTGYQGNRTKKRARIIGAVH
jgi:putative restriction endonuclease